MDLWAVIKLGEKGTDCIGDSHEKIYIAEAVQITTTLGMDLMKDEFIGITSKVVESMLKRYKRGI